MNFRHLMALFGVSLPLCVLLRVLQLKFTIEENTGFINPEFFLISVLIMVIIFIAVAVVVFVSFAAKTAKRKPSVIKPGLSIVSLCVSASAIYEFIEALKPTAVNMWYNNLFVVLSLAAALFFIALSVKNIYDYPLPKLFYILPVLYMVVKLISMFISISSLALISDNVFMILSYCCILLFWLYYSKVENEVECEKSRKLMLVSGMTATMLCAVNSLP